MEATPLWDTVRFRASRPDEGGLDLRAFLQDRLALAQYRPQAAPGVIASRLAGRGGEYYVLKNPATKTYYRLSDRDYFLWERMDGSRTVKDLVVAYFSQYRAFAFGRVAGLVGGLKAGLMLSDQPVNVYQRVQGRLQSRRTAYRLARVWQAFLQKQFALSGLDRALESVYRWGGRFLFARPAQVLYLVVTLLGFYAFFQALRAGDYGVLMLGGSLALGVVGLIVANLFADVIHEMAHALTVKHYGREVRRGGFMIYFGMPAFFVDTTDIWLEGKRARLAVTWAGPYSGLVLGGLASIVLLLWPSFMLNPLLFQFAFLSYLTVFFNLNPLLELDGYYLLMDSLEIPMLRHKSLAFIRVGFWEKVRACRIVQTTEVSAQQSQSAKQRELPAEAGSSSKASVVWDWPRALSASFSREEKIFTVFGLLSAAWTAYAILMGAYFWQRRLAGALRDLWAQGGGAGKMLLALGLAALSLLFVLSIGLALLALIRRLVLWASRRGFLANTWVVATLILVAAVTLSLVPTILDNPVLGPAIGVAGLCVAGFFGWHSALAYTGSRFSLVFKLLAFCSLALAAAGAAGAASAAVETSWLVSPGLGAAIAAGLSMLAYASLVVAGLLLFARTSFQALQLAERMLLALGIAAVVGFTVWLAAGGQRPGQDSGEVFVAASQSLLPLLALVLLVPTLFSYWRTTFGPAWAMLALSLAIMAISGLTGLDPLWAYLLLAGGLLLHWVAYSTLALPTDQPQPEVDLSDARRLQRALGWTVSALLAQFRQIAGDRAGRSLVKRFNAYARAADWQVSIAAGKLSDSPPAELSMIERGERSAAALSMLLGLMVEEVGEKLAVRSLQRAYDGLPWEEREIGGQYLYRDCLLYTSDAADDN